MLYVNIPLHSAVEVFGSYAAINTAIVLLLLHGRRPTASQTVWVPCGLLGMGILDVMHGAVAPGNTFVWLHSLATLVGGFFFVLSWLPRASGASRQRYGYPLTVVVAVLLLGVYSLAEPERIPRMVDDDVFTIAADWINVLGGVFFLLAAPRFLISYRRHGDREDLLFFAICLLLGAAAVLFPWSKAWDLAWWVWHFLRLAGFTVVLLLTLMTFRRLIVSLGEAVATVSDTTARMSATMSQHEATANQQATAAMQASLAIEELSRSSEHSAAQAVSAAESAAMAANSTLQGAGLTRQSVEAMEDLSAKISAMVEQIMHLGDQTREIGGIALLLRDLAEQINILALNATLEAARAGDHGEGFAVVASEIRKLAGQSRKASTEAAALIADVRRATDASVETAEAGVQSVAKVNGLSREMAVLFSELAAIATSVDENAQAVLLNAREQSAAFTQISESAGEIATGAKETSTRISTTRSGISELNASLERLKTVL